MDNCNWSFQIKYKRSLFIIGFGIVLCGVLGLGSQAQPESPLGLEPGDLRLCNNDIGIILWGPNTTPTLSVGKSDVWDRRLPVSSLPVLTLQQINDMAMAGDRRILNGAAYYTSYNSYDFPCPKPVGQLILLLPFMDDGGSVKVTKHPHSLKLEARHREKKIELRMMVSAVRNLIVIDGIAEHLDPGDLSVRLYRHRDTILPGGELHPTLGGHNSPPDFERLPLPRAGTEADCIWIAQDFPPDLTFPAGFVSLLAARVMGSGTDSAVELDRKGLGTPMIAEREGRISHGITKRYTPINEAHGAAATVRLGEIDGAFTIYATVVTTQDAPEPLAASKTLLREAVEIGVESLWREHTQQLEVYESAPHARAWSDDGGVIVDEVWGGNPYRLRPSGYYGDIPFCSVDSTKYCFQDSSSWHADFHFNEVGAVGSCILRQIDYMDPYLRLIHTMLPMAQANALQVYNCRGAMYPLIHYPLKAESVIHSHITWEQSMEITAMLIKPFWLRFLYTWDMDFLRDMAYPVLHEGARFYADFLKKEDDGLYHVFPTVSPEHRGITEKLKFNRDSQSGITLIRYHLRAAARAAELLNCDAEEAARWKEIAGHMPAYPTVQTPQGPIFIDVAGAEPIEYNIPVPLSAVFWGDDIGLDSPPELLEITHRTLRLIDVWEPHRFYLNRVRTLLGIVEPDTALGVENLLQSHTGVIRAFPAVPADFSGGFENFGAQGAFVVSARRNRDGVSMIRIESLAGNECVIADPWGVGEAEVIDERNGQNIVPMLEGLTIQFPTTIGGVYRLHKK